MHDALDCLSGSSCELFKMAYWQGWPREQIGVYCQRWDKKRTLTAGQVTTRLNDICEEVACLMNQHEQRR